MSHSPRHRKISFARRILIVALLILIVILVSLFVTHQTAGITSWANPVSQPDGKSLDIVDAPALAITASPGSQPSQTSAEPASITPQGAALTLPPALPTQTSPPVQPAASSSSSSGLLVAALPDGANIHLFAIQLYPLAFTRLTSGDWDDLTPAVSPDGSQIAFASNRSGHFDLYVLNLASGEASRLTDTPEYDAAPVWSPDGRWLAYESYTGAGPDGNGGNLDILIRELNPENGSGSQPLNLTNFPGADYDPAWSPDGRQIAFVSQHGGDNDIWLADLNDQQQRFLDVSRQPEQNDIQPAWSPDGRYVVWAAVRDGLHQILVWDSQDPAGIPGVAGSGDDPLWVGSSQGLLTLVSLPNHTYLTAYSFPGQQLTLPPIPLSGRPFGMDWLEQPLSQPLPALLSQAAQVTVTPEWSSQAPSADGQADGRVKVVPLGDTQTPSAYLSDRVDEAFFALRNQTRRRLDWDFLAHLDNAYVPLTSPLFMGMLDDWLYTGRAIAVNSGAMNAGWMLAVREDYGADVYWRLYVKARIQDGSQGLPLHAIPWDLNARYSGDPRLYEQGGDWMGASPPGYWVDLTELAARYGWERLPSLSSWRLALAGTRFNEFVHRDQAFWYGAMLEIYPPEAMYTATPMPPATTTPIPANPAQARTLAPTQTVAITSSPTTATATAATPTTTP